MSFTPLLSIEQVAASQDQKEVTINDAFVALEQAVSKGLAVSLASGNATLTTAQYTRNIAFRAQGHSVARVITVPLTQRFFAVINEGTANVTVQGATGSGVVAAAGQKVICFCTGTDVIGFVAATAVQKDGSTVDSATGTINFTGTGVAVTNPSAGQVNVAIAGLFDFSFFISGIAPSSGLILRYVFPRAVSFPANLTGSYVTSRVAATGSNTFTINKNGSFAASATFAASGTTATLATASGAVLSFAAGDVLTVVPPGTADATLADISFSLVGSRT